VVRVAALVEFGAFVVGVGGRRRTVSTDRQPLEFEGLLDVRPTVELRDEDVGREVAAADDSDVAARNEAALAAIGIARTFRLHRTDLAATQ